MQWKQLHFRLSKSNFFLQRQKFLLWTFCAQKCTKILRKQRKKEEENCYHQAKNSSMRWKNPSSAQTLGKIAGTASVHCTALHSTLKYFFLILFSVQWVYASFVLIQTLFNYRFKWFLNRTMFKAVCLNEVNKIDSSKTTACIRPRHL